MASAAPVLALDLLGELEARRSAVDPSDSPASDTRIPATPEDARLLDLIVSSVIDALPPGAHYRSVAAVAALSGKVIRHASICSGTDFGILALRRCVAKFNPMDKALPHIVNVLCVEKVGWKRAWILGHDPPQALCPDASQLTQGRIWDVNQKRWIRPPACDILNVGFSCKSLSVLNNKNRDGVHDAAIAEGRGCSGETARYALAYILKARPAVVLIENVPQIAKGY